MKRLKIILPFLFVIAVLFAGCGSSSPSIKKLSYTEPEGYEATVSEKEYVMYTSGEKVLIIYVTPGSAEDAIDESYVPKTFNDFEGYYFEEEDTREFIFTIGDYTYTVNGNDADDFDALVGSLAKKG